MAALLLSIIAFRFVNPPITPVMVAEKLRGTTLKHRWVPLEDIARDLPLAVIASEDGRFCNHWGVDWGGGEGRDPGGKRNEAVASAARAPSPCRRRRTSICGPTGAMCARSSKCRSPIFSLLLWPKERVIEVYLNVAQWGPGIFGAEAASQHYFHKSASELTRREALLLAVSLPAPRLRNPGKPSPRMLRMAKAVERRMPILAARSVCVVPQLGTPIGLWPARGLATIRALTQDAAGIPRGHFSKVEPWLYPREKPPA